MQNYQRTTAPTRRGVKPRPLSGSQASALNKVYSRPHLAFSRRRHGQAPVSPRLGPVSAQSPQSRVWGKLTASPVWSICSCPGNRARPLGCTCGAGVDSPPVPALGVGPETPRPEGRRGAVCPQRSCGSAGFGKLGAPRSAPDGEERAGDKCAGGRGRPSASPEVPWWVAATGRESDYGGSGCPRGLGTRGSG